MTTDAEPPSHWNAYAARFKLVGPPLRPCPADTRHLRDSVARHAPRAWNAPLRALLLGVTPEIAGIDWQPPVELLAVDRAAGMVEAVWPGDTGARRAEVGDWLELEPPAGGFALVLGDGVLSLFEYPSEYAKLASALARLVRPGGLLWLRLFCRPEPCESVDEVFEALRAGRIGNFHVFKWRLAMALQGDATRGVRLADIWEQLSLRAASPSELARLTGWPEPEISTIEGYRDVRDRYSYSTAREVVTCLAPAFELVETWYPDYELGERCPHLTLRRRT